MKKVVRAKIKKGMFLVIHSLGDPTKCELLLVNREGLRLCGSCCTEGRRAVQRIALRTSKLVKDESPEQDVRLWPIAIFEARKG